MFFCTSSQLVFGPISQESLLEDDMTRDGAQPNCQKSTITWRIIPVSKWLGLHIYKPLWPFIILTLFRGLTNHGY